MGNTGNRAADRAVGAAVHRRKAQDPSDPQPTLYTYNISDLISFLLLLFGNCVSFLTTEICHTLSLTSKHLILKL